MLNRLKILLISCAIGGVLTPLAGILGAFLIPFSFFYLYIAAMALAAHGKLLSAVAVFFGVPAQVGIECGSWIVTLIALPLAAASCSELGRIRWLGPVVGLVVGALACPLIYWAAEVGALPYTSRFLTNATNLSLFSILGASAGFLIGILFGQLTYAVVGRILGLRPPPFDGTLARKTM